MDKFVIGVAFFVAASAALAEDEHQCGEGTHTIVVQTAAECPSLVRTEGNTYTLLKEEYPMECFDTEEQLWTDWPECSGAVQIVEELEVTEDNPEEGNYELIVPQAAPDDEDDISSVVCDEHGDCTFEGNW